MKWIIYIIIFVIFLHFMCYFFNIDLFECFERPISKQETQNDNMDECIDENIASLTKSLDDLKEMI